MLERSRAASPFYTAEHEAFRDMMRSFVAREIEPFAHDWDEAGEFPRELYVKAANIGLLALGFPEDCGGVPADQFMKIVASQELARAGMRWTRAARLTSALLRGRRSRVVLAPLCRRQVRKAPTRHADDGVNTAIGPREERGISRKPLRGGCRMIPVLPL